MENFKLHPRLAAGSHYLGRSAGCQILLKDNAYFPWFLIVPEVPEGMEDLHQLPSGQYERVMELLRQVSTFVAGYFQPEKLNVACIGNQIRQMHLHVVGRHETDPAWPGTVWACHEKMALDPTRVEEIRRTARRTLKLE